MTSTQDDVANIPVFDFMTRNVITIPESQTMKQASKLIYENNIGSILILKEGKEVPIGIVTERDIARTVGFAAKCVETNTVLLLLSTNGAIFKSPT
jgi:CBS domain-containing protein